MPARNHPADSEAAAASGILHAPRPRPGRRVGWLRYFTGESGGCATSPATRDWYVRGPDQPIGEAFGYVVVRLPDGVRTTWLERPAQVDGSAEQNSPLWYAQAHADGDGDQRGAGFGPHLDFSSEWLL